MSKLVIGHDQFSTVNRSMNFPASGDGNYVTLGAAGTASIAVPAGKNLACIQCTVATTVLCGLSAVSYTSSTSFQQLTFNILNLGSNRYRVEGGTDTLHFYSVGASIIRVAFYDS